MVDIFPFSSPEGISLIWVVRPCLMPTPKPNQLVWVRNLSAIEDINQISQTFLSSQKNFVAFDKTRKKSRFVCECHKTQDQWKIRAFWRNVLDCRACQEASKKYPNATYQRWSSTWVATELATSDRITLSNASTTDFVPLLHRSRIISSNVYIILQLKLTHKCWFLSFCEAVKLWFNEKFSNLIYPRWSRRGKMPRLA